MARVDDLIPDVRTHLSGAPDPTCRLYLRRSAKQFCKDSLVWDVPVLTAAVEANIDTHRTFAIDDDEFDVPEQAYITVVSRVELDVPGENEPRVVGERFVRFNIKTGVLTLRSGAITTSGDLEVSAVLEPTRSATTLPDFLVELWGTGIADYAIFQMLLMPKQEWSDPQLAEIFRDKYQRRVSEARTIRAREGTTKTIEVEPIPFN